MNKLFIHRLRINNPNLSIPSDYGLNTIGHHHLLDINANRIYTEITWD